MNDARYHNGEELSRRFASGDRDAFAFVYQKYVRSLIAHTAKTIRRKEDCEEIVQEAFESLWIRREQLHGVTSLQAYLFTIVNHKTVDYLRHSVVKKKYEDHFLLFEAVYDTRSEESHDATELHQWVEHVISELPEKCQAAFRLRLGSNMTYREIAERMGISVKTVEKHIAKAMEVLRAAKVRKSSLSAIVIWTLCSLFS